MKKTRFKIDILSRGDLNDAFAPMITNHNEGKCTMRLSLFSQYAKAKFCEWPTVTPDFTFCFNDEENSLQVMENGKHTLTIQEIEIVELSEPVEDGENDEYFIPDPDDIKNVL